MQQEHSCKNWKRARRQSGAVPIWLLIVLGILSGVLLYWYATPQETPSWVRDWLPGMPEYTGPLYQWRDDQGQVQITDKPPRGQPYDVIQYRSNTNVMPAQER
ncbi:MAG: DUF4124 domain-containing protein [Candidatus Competibacteraceae bacterium]|nr:DUF4124 domain-containing protein [Candidatus Competibacteraceae bacterium]MCB1820545.1 DUF4124 domain-containing protein [Candidatus Competibacteraceae bacterium]